VNDSHASDEDARLAVEDFELWLQCQAWQLREAADQSLQNSRDIDRMNCEFRTLIRCAEQPLISSGALASIRRAYDDALEGRTDNAKDQVDAKTASKRLLDLRNNIEHWAERFAPHFDPFDMSPVVIANLQLMRSALVLPSHAQVE